MNRFQSTFFVFIFSFFASCSTMVGMDFLESKIPLNNSINPLISRHFKIMCASIVGAISTAFIPGFNFIAAPLLVYNAWYHGKQLSWMRQDNASVDTVKNYVKSYTGEEPTKINVDTYFEHLANQRSYVPWLLHNKYEKNIKFKN